MYLLYEIIILLTSPLFFVIAVPSQPRDLRATEIGESSITLEWNKPSHSGESILGYDLMWNDTYSKVSTTL